MKSKTYNCNQLLRLKAGPFWRNSTVPSPLLIALIALFAFIGSSCLAPKVDPLAGWRYCDSKDPASKNQVISSDYRKYIEQLPREEKSFVTDAGINIYEGKNGEHAVRIEIPLNGTWRYHVLFYDVLDRRIKVLKYTGGNYRS